MVYGFDFIYQVLDNDLFNLQFHVTTVPTFAAMAFFFVNLGHYLAVTNPTLEHFFWNRRQSESRRMIKFLFVYGVFELPGCGARSAFYRLMANGSFHCTLSFYWKTTNNTIFLEVKYSIGQWSSTHDVPICYIPAATILDAYMPTIHHCCSFKSTLGQGT